MSSKQWKEDNADKLRTYRRKWYTNNQDRAKKKVYARRKELKAWLAEYRATLACIRCGEKHPACLDFHHRNPEEKDVVLARAYMAGWSRERILVEIAKCDVLCANCHRKEHYAKSNL